MSTQRRKRRGAPPEESPPETRALREGPTDPQDFSLLWQAVLDALPVSLYMVDGDLTVVVGAEKVPKDVFRLVDWNVSVGHQPHSEVAALAVFLDRLLHGAGLRREFRGRVRIRPHPSGKDVEELDP